MVSKEEVLRRVDELAKKVDEQKATFERDIHNQKLAFEKVVDELKGENKKLSKQVVDFSSENAELEGKLQGYTALDKALSQIRMPGGVTADQVRAMVSEEVAKMGRVAATPTEGVIVTEAVPRIDLQVSKPWLTLDEGTLEGEITVLALNGSMSARFTFGDIVKEVERAYAWKPTGGGGRKRLQSALDNLVGKYKTLERDFDAGAKQNFYSLRGDAKSRIKETETRTIAEKKDQS